METTLFIVLKLILLLYLWVLIVVGTLFIFKSRKIYKSIEQFEHQCIYNRRVAIHTLIPALAQLSRTNKTFKMFINPKLTFLNEYLSTLCNLIITGLTFFETLKLGSNFTKKLLK